MGPYVQDVGEALTEETDAFGHRDYAETLAHAVLNAPNPFTVGLFGPWGVGKSTILHELQARLQTRPDIAFVSFDAWRYEGDAFRREFLRDVAGQLHLAGALRRRYKPDKQLGDLYTSRASPHERLGFSPTRGLQALVAAAVVFAVLYALGIQTADALLKRNDASDPAVIAFLALFPVLGYLLTRLVDVLQPRQTMVTQQRLEEPERFTERFSSLLRAVTKTRVVIAIDNVDRMSGDDAVDLLGSVKTYLEPVAAQAGKVATATVVFIIAADRSALRTYLARHASLPAGDAADLTGTAWRDADDHLAKFFNAELTVRTLLDDDIGQYMRRHIRALWSRHTERSWGYDTIVRMCVVALRHNPRRVKQFMNNLELRLQLIAAREHSSAQHAAKIEPQISSELAVITKLALIEEEWPQAYELLQTTPSVLARWTELATGGQTPQPELWPDGDWQAFAAFLRASRDVQPASLRPFLRLRRSAVEAELPRYDAFHDAVISPGSVDAVAEFTRSVGPDLSERYAQRLTDILREELRAGNLDGTVHVLEAGVGHAEFAERVFACKDLLDFAVAEPALLSSLQRVTPQPLLTAARRVGRPIRGKVEAVVAERVVSEAATNAPASGAAYALANATEPLEQGVRHKLREGLRSVTQIDAFGHYLPVLRREPKLLTREAVEYALTAVLSARAPVQPERRDEASEPANHDAGRPLLREAGYAWDVVILGLRASRFADRKDELRDFLSDREDELLVHFGDALAGLRDEAQLRDHLEAISEAVALMSDASGPARVKLAAQVAKQASKESATWRAALKVCFELSEVAEWRSNASQQRTIVEHAAAILGYDRAQLSDDVYPPIRTEKGRRKEGAPTTAAEQWDNIRALQPMFGILAHAAVDAARRRDDDRVAALIEDYPSFAVLPRLAELYLARVEAGSQSAHDIEVFSRSVRYLDKDQQRRLSPLVVRWVTATAQPETRAPAAALLDGVRQLRPVDAVVDALVELLPALPDEAAQVTERLVELVGWSRNDIAPEHRERALATLESRVTEARGSGGLGGRLATRLLGYLAGSEST